MWKLKAMSLRKLAHGLLICGTITIVFLAASRYDIRSKRHGDDTVLHVLDSYVRTTEGEWRCDNHVQSNTLIQTTTILQNWDFTETTKCPKFSLTNFPKPRARVALDCSGENAIFVSSWTNSSKDIDSVKFGDKCLGRFIDGCCNKTGRVPNVIHYVWYTDKEMTFFYFLSVMSALRFVKPCLFLVHGPYIPKGKYWDYFVSISPNIIHVKRERPTSIFGHTLAFPEHSSDVMRIEALKEYGGIYLDYDEVVLRSLEPLRQYQYVQGLEESNLIGSQLIMAEKGAPFLDLWYDSYRTDYSKQWAYNALQIPKKLSTAHPDLIHVDGYNFTRPNFGNAKRKIYELNYDWSSNYAMHMFARLFKGFVGVDIIRSLNTTLGSVSRHVLFGNKELCEK